MTPASRDCPGKLLNLWDMLKFYAEHFVEATQFLCNTQSLFRHLEETKGNEKVAMLTPAERSVSLLDAELEKLRKVCEPLGLRLTVKQIDRVTSFRDMATPLFSVREQAHQVYLRFRDELADQLFLNVPSARADCYDQPIPLMGIEVETEFPDASRDIVASGRCLALDEWTACVFHLMRVLEHGLRKMATRFNVSFKTDSWGKVIKGIEDGIIDLRNKPSLTDMDRREITYYSAAAAQFRHIKDAWRNHVSHAREHYDEREADNVFAHVKELMQHLTTNP